MQIFTPEEIKPFEQTLNLIKQIAYTYRAVKMNNKLESFCLN